PDRGDDELPAHIDRVHLEVVTAVGAEHDLALRLRRGRAELWSDRGAASRAVDELDETLAIRDRRYQSPDREKALVRHALAVAHHRLGNWVAAERLQRQAVGELTTLLGAEHPQVLLARAALAAVGVERGVPDAVPQLRAVLGAQLRRRGVGHPDVALTRHYRG